uniref:Uncharacterized protein n=1 Tax=Rhizophora mucronata TaxID=61149 RepID=A0A2P2KKM3_RHIMU
MFFEIHNMAMKPTRKTKMSPIHHKSLTIRKTSTDDPIPDSMNAT